MCALRAPVRRHWATNLPCERFMICAVSDQRQRHHHQREQRQQRRDPEHHREHRDDGHQRGQQLAHRLLQGGADVVDVVGDSTEQLTARRPVEVAERQPVDLRLDVLAQLAHGVLHDGVEDEALEPAEDRCPGVDRQHQQQHVADRTEVDALAGHDVLALHGGGPLRLGRPRRDLLADEAVEHQVRGVAEDPGSDRHQPDADDAEQHDQDRLATVRDASGRPGACRTARTPSPSGRPCRRPSGRDRGRPAAPRSARWP